MEKGKTKNVVAWIIFGIYYIMYMLIVAVALLAFFDKTR